MTISDAMPIVRRFWPILFPLNPGLLQATPEQAGRLEFFESKIRPVLVQHCYKCHSEESGKSKGELLLDSRVAWQAGGESSPAIIPGKPEESLVIKAISRSGIIPEMPPEVPPSGSCDRKLQKVDCRWGSRSPKGKHRCMKRRPSISRKAGSSGHSNRGKGFQGSTDRRVRQTPAKPARPDKLVRRLFLDLVGLPPTRRSNPNSNRSTMKSPQEKLSALSPTASWPKRNSEKSGRGTGWMLPGMRIPTAGISTSLSTKPGGTATL